MEQVHNKECQSYSLARYRSVSALNTERYGGTEFMCIHTTEMSLEIAPKFIFSEQKAS